MLFTTSGTKVMRPLVENPKRRIEIFLPRSPDIFRTLTQTLIILLPQYALSNVQSIFEGGIGIKAQTSALFGEELLRTIQTYVLYVRTRQTLPGTRAFHFFTRTGVQRKKIHVSRRRSTSSELKGN
jgi:hypothetical protein